jgi:uncharacterized repeat protein (TIGR03803 family)
MSRPGRCVVSGFAVSIALWLVVISPASAQTLSVLHAFDQPVNPTAPYTLLRAADGNFYGLSKGGPEQLGAIVRITPDATITVIHGFTASGAEGTNARGLIQGTDGNLYGWTVASSTGFGSFFKVTTTGALTVLHGWTSFDDNPYSDIFQGQDGNFYFVQPWSGSGGAAVRVTSDGTMTTLHVFNQGDGLIEPVSLIQAHDGTFYGATFYGGAQNMGALFRMTADGSITTLASFGSQADVPIHVLEATDGNLYSTQDDGRILQITPAGAITVLHTFAATQGTPETLIQASDNALYGTRFADGGPQRGTVYKITLSGVFTLLHEFAGGPSDAANPASSLVQSASGDFFGVGGGGLTDVGSLYTMTSAGAVTVVASFERGSSDGARPNVIASGTNGTFVGSTNTGGLNDRGTVFTVSQTGTVAPLYAFTAADGNSPIVCCQMADGSVYGVINTVNGDTAFRIASNGTLTTIHTFTEHVSALILGADGTLYGTKAVSDEPLPPAYGSSPNVISQAFRLLPDGTVINLHTFSGAEATLPELFIQGVQGNFYGVNAYMDPISVIKGREMVYEMTPAGDVRVLGAIPGCCGQPRGVTSLTQAPDGTLFGTTEGGGDYLAGTVFKLTLQGQLTVIYSFTGTIFPTAPDGQSPYGLTYTTDGSLIGISTAFDGARVFRIAPDGRFLLVNTLADPAGSAYHLALMPTNGAIGVSSDGGLGEGYVFRLAPIICDYVVAPSEAAFTWLGGTETVTVTTQPGCTWTATSYAPPGFISITSGASGTGSGSVTYAVSPTTTARTDALFIGGIGGRRHGITQSAPPVMALTPATINFGTVNDAGTLTSTTPAQRILLTQTNPGAVTWTATADQPWLVVSPSSGTGSATLTVWVVNYNNCLPPEGWLNGTITVVASGPAGALAGVINSPALSVNLHVMATTKPTAPIGSVDTPASFATGVTGAIAVTGWALDDVGVTRVRILRDPVVGEGTGAIYIGDAFFVAGARPDVAALYPAWPNKDQAGWGYMLLTNSLPGAGNGTFTLYADADDVDGHTTRLASRTITCANASAKEPFGTIDTPGQGETIASAAYPSFGWALTPQPKEIPVDGSTILVYIDGQPIGAVDGYNNPRSDIETAFPGYANTDGAVGVKILDTTALANGLHTIAWSVTDNQGITAGIGSRFFTVANSAATVVAQARQHIDAMTAVVAHASLVAGAPLGASVITLSRGYAADAAAELIDPDDENTYRVTTVPLERISIDLNPTREPATFLGYVRDGELLRSLPPGSRLDPRTGVFVWAPGLAFGGVHRLVFVREENGLRSVIPIDVTIGAIR